MFLTSALLDRTVSRKPRYSLRSHWRLLMCLAAMTGASHGQEPSAPDLENGVSVLTRGPVHEAFAAPIVHDTRPGLVVPRQPPAPVEELPPDQKPAGQNVQWISGYWSWDQAREDYVWISGVWREPPPGRQWVPGYWHPAAGGFQWIPGAWVPINESAGGSAVAANQDQAAYLPSPPASLEQGPSSPQPVGNVFWTPGCWFWQQSRYVWRPGFWAAVQPEWLWVPAHYVWTPGGFLFVEGYWDLPLASRGILFAPVYYAQPVYLRPAYVFTPSVTIATPGLMANLFVMPSAHHYCFGDYYDRTFLNLGIVPWFSFTYVSGPARPAFYDPLFTFYSSVNIRRDPGWGARLRQDYLARRDNLALRPPRTYIEQTRVIERSVTVSRTTTVLARPLSQAALDRGSRFEAVSPTARQQWRAQGSELRQLGEQRSRQERQAMAWRSGGVGEGRRPGQPERDGPRPRPMALPTSPVAAPVHRHSDSDPAVSRVIQPEHRKPGGKPMEPNRIPHNPIAGDSRAEARPGSPPSRRQPEARTPLADHSRSPGRIAPRDEPKDVAAPGEVSRGRHADANANPPRLHAPPRYTHRQPPSPPRPFNGRQP